MSRTPHAFCSALRFCRWALVASGRAGSSALSTTAQARDLNELVTGRGEDRDLEGRAAAILAESAGDAEEVAPMVQGHAIERLKAAPLRREVIHHLYFHFPFFCRDSLNTTPHVYGPQPLPVPLPAVP